MFLLTNSSIFNILLIFAYSLRCYRLTWKLFLCAIAISWNIQIEMHVRCFINIYANVNVLMHLNDFVIEN